MKLEGMSVDRIDYGVMPIQGLWYHDKLKGEITWI